MTITKHWRRPQYGDTVGGLDILEELKLAGVVVDATAAELNTLNAVTPGTVAASKAVVPDANKDIASFRNLTGTGLLSGGTVQGKDVVATVSADGAIAIAPGIVKITKAGVAVLTLADPAVGDEGTVMLITSQTANAHTVSNAAGSGFNAGGGGSDIGTFGGAIGDNMLIVAINAKWHVISLHNVTLG